MDIHHALMYSMRVLFCCESLVCFQKKACVDEVAFKTMKGEEGFIILTQTVRIKVWSIMAPAENFYASNMFTRGWLWCFFERERNQCVRRKGGWF